METVLAKLKEVLSELNKITSSDTHIYKRNTERVKAIVDKKFEKGSNHIIKINSLLNRLDDWGLTSEQLNDCIGFIQILIDEIEIEYKEPPKKNYEIRPLTPAAHAPTIKTVKTDNLSVFIVHGHNDSMKLATARTIEKLGLKPIILHEQASGGDTIIEKFTRYSEVGFAIVLLSADDYGYPKKENFKNARLRARQNVIFELGFFTAKLGRKRVVAIFEEVENFEKPSDIDGVVYIPYKNSDGKWRFDLAQELRDIGYEIDLNKLVK